MDYLLYDSNQRRFPFTGGRCPINQADRADRPWMAMMAAKKERTRSI
jgi:hypothetical protein